MTIIKHAAGAAALGAALLISAGLLAPPAEAGYIVTLTQQGGNVVANGGGRIELIGLNPIFGSAGSPLIVPSQGHILVGSPFTSFDVYSGSFAGPAKFGGGGLTSASSGSGDFVGIFVAASELIVPVGYGSDVLLSDTATWDSQTFASLGVTPGTSVWTWGPDANQSFTFRVVPPTVPEPGSLLLLGAALIGFCLIGWRCRRA